MACAAPVGLDEPTVYSLTPRQAMNAFDADSLHYVLTEDRHGFFDAAGIVRPRSGGEDILFRFTPSSTNAMSFGNCPSGTGPVGDAFEITGIITAELLGVRITVPGKMTIALSKGMVPVEDSRAPGLFRVTTSRST
jgi:hypothetical protein